MLYSSISRRLNSGRLEAFRCIGGFRGSASLKSIGLDNSQQQCGGTPRGLFDTRDDPVDGLQVMIIHASTECIGKQFFGQTAVKVAGVLVGENSLQFHDSCKFLASDELPVGIDRLPLL